MLHPPVRNSLVEQVVRILLRQIATRKMKEKLPGEYPLCNSLQVSRTTLRAALDILQRRGYVQTRQGAARIVVSKPRYRSEPKEPRAAFLLAGDPLNALPHSGVLLRAQIIHTLQEHGYRCHYWSNRRFAVGSPRFDPKCAATATDHLWILASCSAATQNWFFCRGYRAFVVGHLHPGVRLPGFDLDFSSIGQHAAFHFLAHGHRNFALIFPNSGSAGNDRLVDAFCDVARRAGVSADRVTVLKFRLRPAEMDRNLEKMLSLRPRPTALYVSTEDLAISLYSHLLARGFSVPGDISIIVGFGGPLLRCFRPAFTYYNIYGEREMERICRLVVNFAGHIATLPTWHSFMPDFHVGETVANVSKSKGRDLVMR